MRLNNQLLNWWTKNLEVIVTVIWLLYFIGVRTPSPIPQMMKALSYVIIFILVILHWKRLSWVATRDIPLLLLLGTVLASVFWSVNPELTLDGCRGLLRTFLFGAYFTIRYSIVEQMKILAWVFGIGAILALAWQDIFLHKNILGYAMTIGAILFLLTAIKDRRINWLVWSGFALSVFLLLLARSSGSLVTLLVLLSLMPVYKLVRQHYKLRVILLSMVCILVCSVAIFIFANVETILVDILNEGITFNGRTPIWNLVIEKTLERPWLGYGYNAFWKSDAGMYVINNTWAEYDKENVINSSFNSHSGYFELLPQLGFLGISLYAISLITVFTRVFNLLLATKKIEFFWLLQLLIFISVANIGDMFVSILGSTSSYSSIYVSICLSTAIEYRRIRVSQNQYVVS
jgi:O-antigen ligase